jgi:DsbC/DsbD-like thiol-disulfide interchange protein
MKKILLLITALVLTIGAYAQIEAPVKWSYAAKKINSTEAVVFIKATIQSGWHIYSANLKDGGPIKTSFTFSPSKEYALVGKVSEPAPLTKYEKSFSMNVTYFENSVIFQQKIKLKSAKTTVVKGQLEYMTCNDKKCLPPEDVDFSIPLGK